MSGLNGTGRLANTPHDGRHEAARLSSSWIAQTAVLGADRDGFICCPRVWDCTALSGFRPHPSGAKTIVTSRPPLRSQHNHD
jgi:hypothetical protein